MSRYIAVTHPVTYPNIMTSKRWAYLDTLKKKKFKNQNNNHDQHKGQAWIHSKKKLNKNQNKNHDQNNLGKLILCYFVNQKIMTSKMWANMDSFKRNINMYTLRLKFW